MGISMKTFLAAVSLLGLALAVPKPPPGADKYKDEGEWKPPPSDKDATTLPPIQPRDSDIACGTHQLSVGSYDIQSPNHPSNYDNYYDCTYSLTAEAGAVLSVSYSAFNIESHSTCGWDWLKVQGVKYCGTEMPPAITDATTLEIEFHTDYSVVRTGFALTVSVTMQGEQSGTLTCGTHTLQEGTYTIESPNH